MRPMMAEACEDGRMVVRQRKNMGRMDDNQWAMDNGPWEIKRNHGQDGHATRGRSEQVISRTGERKDTARMARPR